MEIQPLTESEKNQIRNYLEAEEEEELDWSDTDDKINWHRIPVFNVEQALFSRQVNHPTTTITELHNKYLHAGKKVLKILLKREEDRGIKIIGNLEEFKCDVCAKVNMKQQPYPALDTFRNDSLIAAHERYYHDLSGKAKVPAFPDGTLYRSQIMDHTSNYGDLRLIRNKYDARQHVYDTVNRSKNQFGKNPRSFYSDTAGETVMSTEFKTFMSTRGIDIIGPPVATHQPNGKIEKLNQDIERKTIVNLEQSGLPYQFWGLAAAYSNIVRNFLPCSANQDFKSPYEIYENKPPPSIDFIYPFGCKAIVYIQPENQQKYFAKADEGVLVGINLARQEWIFLIKTEEQNFILRSSRNAKFFSAVFPYRQTNNTQEQIQQLQNLKKSWNPIYQLQGNEDDFEDNLPELERQNAVSEPLDSSDEEEVKKFVNERKKKLLKKTKNDTDTIKTDDAISDANDVKLSAIFQASNPWNPLTKKIIQHQVKQIPQLPSIASLYDTPKDYVLPSLFDPDDNKMPELEKDPVTFKKRKKEKIVTQTTRTQPDRTAKKNPDYINEKVVLQLQPPPAPIQIKEKTFSEKNSNQQQSISKFLKTKIPTNIHVALEDPKWKKAILEEYDYMEKENVVELVEMPENQNVIDTLMVFAVKDDGRYRARMTVRGDQEKVDVESFASVVNKTSLLIGLTNLAINDHDVVQFDVTKAFLLAELEPDRPPVYIKLPPGYDTSKLPTDKSKKYCWRGRKGIYGMDDAFRGFNKLLRKILLQLGFKNSIIDWECYYRVVNGVREEIYIHVDDGALIGKKSNILKVIKELEKIISLRYSLELNMFLGWQVTRNRSARNLMVSMPNYILTLTNVFGPPSNRIYYTPIEPNNSLLDIFQKSTNSPEPKTILAYQKKLGKLMYTLGIRKDVYYAVNYASQFVTNPQPEHFNLLNRIFNYLYYTANFGLVLGNLSDTPLECYVDASHNAETKGRSRHSSLLYFFGSLVAGSSKIIKQPAFSSAESEYHAIAEGAKLILYAQQFLESIELPVSKPTVLKTDNKAAIYLTESTKFHERTKHISLKCHAIRFFVTNGDVKIEFVRSKDQAADGLTKPRSTSEFIKFRSLLNIRDVSSMQGNVRNNKIQNADVITKCSATNSLLPFLNNATNGIPQITNNGLF